MFQRIEFDDSFLENRKLALYKHQGCAYVAHLFFPQGHSCVNINTPNNLICFGVKTLSSIILPSSQKNALVPLTSPGMLDFDHLQAFPSKRKLKLFSTIWYLTSSSAKYSGSCNNCPFVGLWASTGISSWNSYLGWNLLWKRAQTLARILLQGWSHFW